MTADNFLFAWRLCVKLFFLFAPFAVMNFFISVSEGVPTKEVRTAARRITIATLLLGILFYFSGDSLLKLFGLELNGFRIGAGMLLMFTALNLALKNDVTTAPKVTDLNEIVVVPMAIPTIWGPSSLSTVIVISAEEMHNAAQTPARLFIGLLGVLVASLALGFLLYFSGWFERALGKKTIRIFSKLSGLILTVLASQMIARGFCSYLDESIVGAKIISFINHLEATL